ncbi:MAG: FHA domain-containing protein, partial [Planctomycetota bacterium]
MPSLVVLSGKSVGQTFDLSAGEAFELGTARKAHIHLRDRGVSYQHAKIVRRADGLWLEDGGSPQGTTINRARVNGARRLDPGDVLGVGDIELRFEDAAAAMKPAPVPAPPPTPQAAPRPA